MAGGTDRKTRQGPGSATLREGMDAHDDHDNYRDPSTGRYPATSRTDSAHDIRSRSARAGGPSFSGTYAYFRCYNTTALW
eukprot:3940895-Rhodomonas_salina.4